MVDLAGIGSIIGGVGGLFGNKGHDAGGNSSLAIRGQAHGARLAAKKFGFNALTLLKQSSPVGGNDVGGPPPLASLAVVGDGLDRLYGEQAQDAETARVYNQLQNDLLRVQVDQARGSVYLPPPPSAVAAVSPSGSAPALNGGRVAPQAYTIGTTTPSLTFGSPGFSDRSVLTPERPTVAKPTEDISGIIQVNNAITGPVTFAGADGEIFMEYLQIPIVGGPQVAWNWGSRFGDYMREQLVPGGVPLQQYIRDRGPRVWPETFQEDWMQ